jgi:hypothetical protein
MDKLKVIVTGLIGQHYGMGGVTWDYLQYLVGLKILGHEVYYFEDSGEWPYNFTGGPTGDQWEAKDCEQNIRHIHQTLQRYGLENNWAYRYPVNNTWFGMSETKRKNVIKEADILFNVSGTLMTPENYREVSKLVYIDSDPGFTELKMRESRFNERVNCHDHFFSFGELLFLQNTDSGIKWLPTRSPIVLSEWNSPLGKSDHYTTIMNWTSYKPLEKEGKIYGQKDVEFIKFLELPQRKKECSFEVAMAPLQHDNWKTESPSGKDLGNFKSPQELLTRFGWKLTDAHQKCNNMDNYREYIFNSRGEWSVAKGGYVVDKSGWFSCRTACYLAAGKPAIVQNTGFDKILPTGFGLFAFESMEEIENAVELVEGNYKYHCEKAKELAKAYLDSDKVLPDLIDSLS